MKRLLKIVLGAISSLIKPITEPEASHLVRNVKSTPTCCDKSMEYIGEHSSNLWRDTSTQFYQCQECKRIELLHK